MTVNDWKKFTELMTTAAEYYRVQPWSERAMQYAFGLLKDLTIEQVGWALTRHMSGINGNSSRFCPNAADLRMCITGTPEQQAIAAWVAVQKAYHTVSSGKSVRFDDPKIHYALQAVGGWSGLFNARVGTDKEPTFRRAYVQAITDGIGWGDVPDHMPGEDELDGNWGWSPNQIEAVATIRQIRVPAPTRLAAGDAKTA